MKIIYMRRRDKSLAPYEVKVDDEDYEKLSQYRWHLSLGYAVTKKNDKVLLMHRFIMNAPKGMLVDHINHNELDNRKSNLRLCDSFINMQNRRKGRGAVKKIVLNEGKYTYYFGEVRKYHKRYITITCPTPEQAKGAMKQMIKDKEL